MIELRNVHKHHGVTHAVAGVTFRLETGESAALLGPSGSGKTSLLRLVSGLDRPDTGTIEAPGVIGMVFQSLALWPHVTVRGQIELVLHDTRWNHGGRHRRVDEILQRFNLEPWADRRPGTLSGGEQQRVALARALAPEPEILLLDEPLAHLDAENRRVLRAELAALFKDRTVLIATHDEQDAACLAQRCLRLNAGRLEGDL